MQPPNVSDWVDFKLVLLAGRQPGVTDSKLVQAWNYRRIQLKARGKYKHCFYHCFTTVYSWGVCQNFLIRPHKEKHRNAETYRTKVMKAKAWPGVTEGRGSECRATCGIHNAPVFIQRKCGTWQMLLLLLRNDLFLLGWERLRKSYPARVKVGRFERGIWPAEPACWQNWGWHYVCQKDPLTSLDGLWIIQTDGYGLSGFGSSVIIGVKVTFV